MNNSDPTMIGQCLSALSNSALLKGEPYAYMIWGITDGDHQIAGTSFDPFSTKGKGNEDLIPWLARKLQPETWFEFLSVDVDAVNGRVVTIVMCEIASAVLRPVAFDGQRYVRVDTATKPLLSVPAHEAQLWQVIGETAAEGTTVTGEVSPEEALALLDYELFFKQAGESVPQSTSAILQRLSTDDLIVHYGDTVALTNLGTLFYARDLSDFPRLRKKRIRFVRYDGVNRVASASFDQTFDAGYARSLETAVQRVVDLSPTNEAIQGATRISVPTYPELAVRELVANGVIHQDLSVSGSAPTVEMFSDRLEISNPGEPLVEVLRFLDTPPRSRNEASASLMRRADLCEERGSGIDKVVQAIELFQLPAPLFEVKQGSVVATLYAPLKGGRMTKKDRNRALYLHACLRYVSNQRLTNASVRERLNKNDPSMVSGYIKDAIAAELIVPHDQHASRSKMSYVPYWAGA